MPVVDKNAVLDRIHKTAISGTEPDLVGAYPGGTDLRRRVLPAGESEVNDVVYLD